MEDILELLDRLEALVNEGWRIPFTVKTVINEVAFFEIIDKMRVSVPQELRRADELLENRESVMAAAAADAERIREEAREQAARLLDEHEIIAAARAEAERIRAQGQMDAEKARIGADEYALDALSDLEARLSALLRTTSNGLASLKRRQGLRSPEEVEGES